MGAEKEFILEVELKYKLKNKSIAGAILADEYIAGIEEKGTREQVFMKAAYFDTEDGILSKNDIALRVRMEGARIIASLKWNDSGAGGLHMREEINVPTADSTCFIKPDPNIFKESEVGKDVLDLLNDKPLESILEMKFIRDRLRVDTGAAICEIALDDGKIITDGGEIPISELEIELFSGEKDELLKLGDLIAEKYELEMETETKYARGLKLLRGV
ncbi:MAG: CYTH domain-containing protein [Clostridiales Family XIII bacterium]|nr:CYTH domain-containing protein [Clostridiales Family XIII bacterium]